MQWSMFLIHVILYITVSTTDQPNPRKHSKSWQICEHIGESAEYAFRDIKVTCNRATQNILKRLTTYTVEFEICSIVNSTTNDTFCYEEENTETDGKKNKIAKEDWIDCAIGCPIAGGTAGGLAIGLLAVCYQFDFANGYVTYSPKALSQFQLVQQQLWHATVAIHWLVLFKSTCPKSLSLVPDAGTIEYSASVDDSSVPVGATADIMCDGQGSPLMIGQFVCGQSGWTESCTEGDCLSYKSDVSNAYYKIKNKVEKKKKAVRKCAKHCSQLATIIGDAQYEFVKAKILEKSQASNKLHNNYYIGFERLENSPTGAAAEPFLKWFDGTEFTYKTHFWFEPPGGKHPLNPNCNECWDTCSCKSCGSISFRYYKKHNGLGGFNDVQCVKDVDV